MLGPSGSTQRIGASLGNEIPRGLGWLVNNIAAGAFRDTLSATSSMGHSNKRRRTDAAALIEPCTATVDQTKYTSQLASKAEKLRSLFADFAPPDLEIYPSVTQHYRLRAEFRVWQNADDLYYIMYEKAPDGGRAEERQGSVRQRVDAFPVASELVNELMASVIEHARGERPLRQKLFQANFHSTLSGEAMVTLVYHRQLDDAWRDAAERLRQKLSEAPHATRISLIGRSKNQKVVLGRDFVEESMEVDGRTFEYKQVEGAFSQPNGYMCRNMLSWARDVTRGSQDGNLLELYCGNGNFTVALADNFREVIATEVSKASVAAAQHNLLANGVRNTHVARLSSEEFTQAWRGEREFFRLKDLPVIHGREFSTLLVDPPRAGLDETTADLLARFDNLVYISCNPATMRANLNRVAASHQLVRLALFDQFPYTEHIECGALLSRTARPRG